MRCTSCCNSVGWGVKSFVARVFTPEQNVERGQDDKRE